jgi:hypothetical protein
MRGPRSTLSTGLTVLGLHLMIVSIFGAGTLSAAALHCECKSYKDGICIPADPDCKRAYKTTQSKQKSSRKKGGGTNTGGGYAVGRYSGPAYYGHGRHRHYGQYRHYRQRTRPVQVREPSPPKKKGADTGYASPGHSVWTAGEAPRPRILDTGYGHLAGLGGEAGGYGLYSYAILPSDSERAAAFLSQVFKEIPSIGNTSATRSQLNILYIPLLADKQAALPAMIDGSHGNAKMIGAQYTKSFYDYRLARGLLSHICNPPDPSILDLCNGDLSRGPYIFTYALPASTFEPVPPPFLFVDLSDVHDRAFGEFLAAFQAQVKREDFRDQAKLQTFRLRLLDVTLTAADWVSPIQKAIADIVRSATGGGDKK